MIISRYFVYFILFSFLGWVYETIFCTVRRGHFQNRGFLFGPVCPIYGTGVMLIVLASDGLAASGMEASLDWWQLFLIYMVGSAVLEYATSWVMEKLFHARWWDYSRMPLNINGRVCLPASLLFGGMGLLVSYLVVPFLHVQQPRLSALGYEGLSLVLMAIFAADVALSNAAATRLLSDIEAATNSFDEKMESGVQAAMAVPKKMGEQKDRMVDAVSDAGADARSAVADARAAAGAAMDEARVAVGEAASDAKAAVGAAASEARAAVGVAADGAREAMNEAASSMKQKAGAAKSHVPSPSEALRPRLAAFTPGERHHLRNIRVYQQKDKQRYADRLRELLTEKDQNKDLNDEKRGRHD